MSVHAVGALTTECLDLQTSILGTLLLHEQLC